MKPLYTKLRVTDNTKTQNLPVMQQLQLLFGKLNTDGNTKLEAEEKISRANLEMQSALSNMISVVTNKMKELGYHCVTLAISSRFEPYFESVFSSETGKGRFYDFEIENHSVPVNGVDYFIKVTVREKEDD